MLINQHKNSDELLPIKRNNCNTLVEGKQTRAQETLELNFSKSLDTFSIHAQLEIEQEYKYILALIVLGIYNIVF